MCAAAFNPYGTILATGCKDGHILVWSWETRTLVRRLSPLDVGEHPSRIVALTWSTSGRHLQSASKNGTIIVWDVAIGNYIHKWKLDVDGADVCALSGSRSAFFDDSSCVVSLAPPLPSYYVTLKKQEQFVKSQIPFVDLQVASGRVRKVDGNSVKDFYVSKLSPSGNVLLSASYSTISLLRTSDMAILDVVGMRKGWVSGPSDPSILIEFSPDGRRVLVTGRTCKLIRVFDIFDGLQYQNRDFIEEVDPISSELIAETVQRQKQPKEEGSLFFTSVSSTRLRLTRIFEASIEKCDGWAAAAFSPDGSHLVGAISSDDEHVMYIWNVEHGYAASTLQAGVGGIEALCWHPRPAPAQLLAVCSTGKLCVWAKILSQWWSAFAPDFETLAENREHNETETEFDVVLKEGIGQGKGDEAMMEVDDDSIDIVSWDWLESDSSRKGASSRMWDPKQKQTEHLIAMPVQLGDQAA